MNSLTSTHIEPYDVCRCKRKDSEVNNMRNSTHGVMYYIGEVIGVIAGLATGMYLAYIVFHAIGLL